MLTMRLHIARFLVLGPSKRGASFSATKVVKKSHNLNTIKLFASTAASSCTSLKLANFVLCF